jgi:hypothetical protein
MYLLERRARELRLSSLKTQQVNGIRFDKSLLAAIFQNNSSIKPQKRTKSGYTNIIGRRQSIAQSSNTVHPVNTPNYGSVEGDFTSGHTKTNDKNTVSDILHQRSLKSKEFFTSFAESTVSSGQIDYSQVIELKRWWPGPRIKNTEMEAEFKRENHLSFVSATRANFLIITFMDIVFPFLDMGSFCSEMFKYHSCKYIYGLFKK